MKLVVAYLEAFRSAPNEARKGFALFIGDYLATCTGGCVPDAKSYRAKQFENCHVPEEGAPRAVRECEEHARAWLTRAAKAEGVRHG